MVKRWKERHRSHSGTSSATNTTAPTSVSRPTTAVGSWAEYQNHALPKVLEDAILAAFSGDAFRNTVASIIDPSLSRQQEKMNQLKLANLNLQSTFETRLDELSLLLQPAINHMTTLEVPNNEKDLERLATGQERCLDIIESLHTRLNNLESQLQGFDGRMKSLEDKVVNGDLRQAIRFGEISNELQDQNTTLVDRIWEIERELGSKIDGQQRRLAFEDLSKAIRKTQEGISSLETVLNTRSDEDSASLSELLDKVEHVSKSISKSDATCNGLRRDINEVRSKVSLLDTSTLESYPKKMDSIERTLSSFKKELETQGTLASLDSKLLSANNARLNSLATDVTNIGYLIESIKEEISDDEIQITQMQKLGSILSKVADIAEAIAVVQRDVGSLNESNDPDQSTRIADISSAMTRLENSVKIIDTTPLASHSNSLAELKSKISEIQSNLADGLSSQDRSLHTISEKFSLVPTSAEVESILKSLEDIKRMSSEESKSLSNAVNKVSDTVVSTHDHLSSHHKTLQTASHTLTTFHTETANALRPLSSHLEDIRSQISHGDKTVSTLDQRIQEIVSMLATQGADLAEIQRDFTTSETLLAVKDLKSSQEAEMESLEQMSSGIKKIMEEIHGSTISEIRHKSATIIAGIEKSNSSHAKHSAALITHEKAFQDGFTSLGAVQSESQTRIESICSCLDAAKSTDSAHSVALNEILALQKKNSTSVEDLNTCSTNLLSKSSEILTGIRGSAEITTSEVRKLSTVVAEVREALAPIEESSEELLKIVRGNTTKISKLDENSTGTHDLVSHGVAKLQTVVEELEATLVKSHQDTISELAGHNDKLVAQIDGSIQNSSSNMELQLKQQKDDLQQALQDFYATLTHAVAEAAENSTRGNEKLGMAINENVSESFSKLVTQLSTSTSLLDNSIISAQSSTIESRKAHTTTLESIKSSISGLSTIISETHIPSILSIIENAIVILHSHSGILDNVKSELLTNNKSNSSELRSISSNLESIASEIGTTTAAVRVNSAAISRVDNAVLETGAQVKGVVLEGNFKTSRAIDAALEQLEGSIHDSRTRIMGISEFDLPRLEGMLKGLEGTVERAMNGNLKVAGRNRDALSVIGARIIGTQKIFDEMVEAHSGHDEDSHGVAMTGSWSPGGKGIRDHRRIGSVRLRRGSNGSSGRETTNSGLKTIHYS